MIDALIDRAIDRHHNRQYLARCIDKEIDYSGDPEVERAIADHEQEFPTP